MEFTKLTNLPCVSCNRANSALVSSMFEQFDRAYLSKKEEIPGFAVKQ
jgi:hypothetical protein